MVLVYECKNVQDEINQNSNIKKKLKEIQLKKTEVEADQLTEEIRGLHNFRQDTVDRIWRLLFEKVKEEHKGKCVTVYCLRAVFHRNDLDNPQGRKELYEEWLSKHPLSDEEKAKIKQFVKKEVDRYIQSQSPTPLPEEYKRWCEVFTINLDELVLEKWIYESEMWVEEVRMPEFRMFATRYYDLLNDIMNYTANVTQINNIKIATGKDDVKIYFKEFPEFNIFFLFKPDRSNENESVIEKIRERHPFILKDKIVKNELISHARKAYPDVIFASHKDWLDIEEDHEANLALSPEEEEILKNIRFPSFINGQAGSGKSTMLYYLFAEYYYKKGKSNLPGQPLFLTYSKPLVNTSMRLVTNILKNWHRYKEQTINLNYLDRFFVSFQDYIFKEILPVEYHGKFSYDKYVNFYKFKKLYEKSCQLPEKRHFSPEIIWYVIRTFIKGYNKNKFLTHKDYELLPRKDRTIDSEDYEKIYNTIWSWYRNLSQERALWDDQDLVREALVKGDFKDIKYPVIFCDEAQDFTRIELEMILNSSIFRGHDLAGIEWVPFVFAGDPSQSINPTGFRWEALKGNFHKVFSTELRLDGLELADYDLKHNYRSVGAVVRFCNTIQFYRKKYLDEKSLEPQKIWFQNEGSPPTYYELTSDAVNQLKEIGLQDNIIIIPGDTGNEEDFLREENELQGILSELEGNIDDLLFTSGSAKGLEFRKVILYKWGEYGKELIKNLINNKQELSESEVWKVAYFFNKLYVAASRAKEGVFILDTKEGIEDFWHYFCEESINREEIENDWRDLVGTIHKGYDLRELKEENPLAIALEIAAKGREREDFELLERAATRFRRLGLEKDALLCEAESAEFKREYQIAGNKYLKLMEIDKSKKEDYIDKANECFWCGCHWKEILEHPLEKSNMYKLREKLAGFMVADTNNQKVLLDILSDDEIWKHSNLNERPWKDLVKKITKHLEELLSVPEKYDITKIANQVSRISERGFSELYGVVARLFYYAKNYDKAVDFWERTGTPDNKEYYYAKGMVSNDINDKIRWWSRADYNKEIIRIVENSVNSMSINNDIQKIVVRIFEKDADYDRVFDLSIKWKDFDEALDLVGDRKVTNNAKIEQMFDMIYGLNDIDRFWKKIRKILKMCSTEHVVRSLLKLIENGHYIEFIELIKDRDRKDFTLTDKLNWGAKLIESLCTNTITPNRFPNDAYRRTISEFIFKDILNWDPAYQRKFTGNEKWFLVIDPTSVATALERSGSKYQDLLAFYDNMIKYYDGKDYDTERWLKRRYIKIKFKYAEYLNSNPQKTTMGKELKGKGIKARPDSPDKHIKEAKDKMDKWGISLADENEPDLPLPLLRYRIISLPEGVDKSIDNENGFLKLTWKNFTIKVFYNENRIIVRNESNEKAVRIYIDQFDVKSDDLNDLKKEVDQNNNILKFSTQSLKLKGQLHSNGRIRLQLLETHDIELELPQIR